MARRGSDGALVVFAGNDMGALTLHSTVSRHGHLGLLDHLGAVS